MLSLPERLRSFTARYQWLVQEILLLRGHHFIAGTVVAVNVLLLYHETMVWRLVNYIERKIQNFLYSEIRERERSVKPVGYKCHFDSSSLFLPNQRQILVIPNRKYLAHSFFYSYLHPNLTRENRIYSSSSLMSFSSSSFHLNRANWFMWALQGFFLIIKLSV